MAKKNVYSVRAEKHGQHDCLWISKNKDGAIDIQLNSSEATFSVKECKEIIEKLKACIKE